MGYSDYVLWERIRINSKTMILTSYLNFIIFTHKDDLNHDVQKVIYKLNLLMPIQIFGDQGKYQT